MSRDNRIRRTITTRVWLFAGLMLTGSTPGFAASAEQEQVRADCLIEGEAVGLSGAELNDFVAQCVADLQAVELSNPQE